MYVCLLALFKNTKPFKIHILTYVCEHEASITLQYCHNIIIDNNTPHQWQICLLSKLSISVVPLILLHGH